MKNIIFIAPPAAGKGTQAKLLAEKYNIPHISTGDLLREEASKSTDLGLKIKNIMETGALVSDEINNSIVENKSEFSFCTYCGAPNEDGDLFCAKCGHKFE